MAGQAALGVITALIFLKTLPPSRHFEPAPQSRLLAYLRTVGGLFADPGLPWLLVLAFCLMGSFIALFNTLAFRLTSAPFNLGNAAVGAVFLAYLTGAPVSSFFGRMGDRYGRTPIIAAGLGVILIGLAATLPDSLIGVVFGLCVITAAFFGTHALASAWVTARAPQARGQASALYLQFVYLGPSLIGALSGWQWTHHGWPGVLVVLMGTFGLSLAVVLLSPLRRLGLKGSGAA